MKNILPSIVQELIDEFEKLPGIGPRSAARLALYLLRAPDIRSERLSDILAGLNTDIMICKICYNYAEDEICPICKDGSRNKDIIMVVEEPLDVIAFERADNYEGLYHVLGGVISPVNGIGPEEIRINELDKRLKVDNNINEIIIATNPSLEGESTALYIKKQVRKYNSDVTLSRLARGLPSGADLEYADSTTLRKSLEGRVNF